MTTSLQRRLETLYGLERRKDKLGLDGTRALLAALGDPHDRFRSVHVGGTNGKGSVCALVERVLREAGHRTGLYTSPHLVDFRERIRVNGRWVDEEWLERALDRIEALSEGKDRTFFEVATALGFLYFAEQKVEIAVVEVGLGGRLDCTNVITPELSVITTIGLDHQEILGETLEQIAVEKAGILKPGVPAVLPQSTMRDFLVSIALERGAPIADAPPGLSAGSPRGLPIPQRAPAIFRDPTARRQSFGVDNLLIAELAFEALIQRGIAIPREAIESGLRSARWPGRFESCPAIPRLWWDGAHNGPGLRRLGETWELLRGNPPERVVLAVSRDKDVANLISELHAAFPRLVLIVTQSQNERAAEPRALAEAASRQGLSAEVAPDLRAAVERALAASGTGDVLLTGSLFAVGEAMEAFGGAPGEQL